GIYSLSPYTLEEVVARNYLIGERPDAIINIVDGTNIERNLYLTTQIMELGIPVIMAVNMADLLEKNGDKIHLNKLSEKLGCEVVSISALKGTGIKEAAEKAVKLANARKVIEPAHEFSAKAEEIISAVENRLTGIVPAEQERFFAIKLLEKDDKIASQMKSAPDVSAEIKEMEDAFDDDTESIITNERYVYISSIIGDCVTKNRAKEMSTSDKIDRIVTNRWLALPIFAVIMWIVYYVSVTTVGAILTDWTNDTLFGEWIIPAAQSFFEGIGCADWLTGLIVDGIISGVGAVLGFVPQMLVLFFFLAILESCGYMARVAFIMDRIFRKFGLSGKSFIPMLIGTGCGVPGVMASRTIENDRDRKMTIMTTTFIPCGAKLPIIALIAGAIFNGASWVAPSAYFVGIAAIICSGIILKKTKMFAGDPAPFVMELPAYHMPTAGNVLRSMWERGWSFIKKAGTIITLSTIVVWFLLNFGWVNGHFGMLNFDGLEGAAMEAAQAECILAKIGNLIAWIFTPLGWGNWKMAVAAITGLVAKENVVGTFGQLFGFAKVAEDGTEIWGQLAGSMTVAAGYSFLVFNLLCAPCFAAMGAIKREMNNAKWFWFAIGYQCVLAYIVSLCIYQIGTLAMGGGFGLGTIVAFILILGFVYLLFRPYKESKTLNVNVRSVAGAK
ncbi:MAG: ferrous iron transport protein B, partial [Lachnospiraceae bacterium]|nr:ferrous iron transport protein B [Lachnospiraceae bacterium]